MMQDENAVPSPRVKARAPFLRGSARGARVVGSVSWVVVSLMLFASTAFVGFGVYRWLAFLLPLYLLVRPWFMGVWLSDDVTIRGWWTRHVVPLASIEEVGTQAYGGILHYSEIGYLPASVEYARSRFARTTRTFRLTIRRRWGERGLYYGWQRRSEQEFVNIRPERDPSRPASSPSCPTHPGVRQFCSRFSRPRTRVRVHRGVPSPLGRMPTGAGSELQVMVCDQIEQVR